VGWGWVKWGGVGLSLSLAIPGNRSSDCEMISISDRQPLHTSPRAASRCLHWSVRYGVLVECVCVDVF